MATHVWNSDLSIANDNDDMIKHLAYLLVEFNKPKDLHDQLVVIESIFKQFQEHGIELGLSMKYKTHEL